MKTPAGKAAVGVFINCSTMDFPYPDEGAAHSKTGDYLLDCNDHDNNNSYNMTQFDMEDLDDINNRFVQIYTLLALAALGFIGNVLVVGLLQRKCRRKHYWSNIDYLILQLSIADLLVAVFCVLADAIWKITFQWLAGDIMCKLIKYMQMFSLYASTFIIVTISLDRCIAIVNPIPKFDHHKLVRLLTLISWIGAGVCSIPQLAVFGVRQAPIAVTFYQCVTHGFYQQEWHEAVYVLFTFCVMGAIPLLIITASYTAIFMKLNLKLHRTLSRKKSQKSGSVALPVSFNTSPRNNHHELPMVSSSGEIRREALLRRAMMRSLWISILVIITFIICWGPYYIAMLYYMIVHDANDKGVQSMSQIIFFFGMSNSVLNPLIYGACHLFRKSQLAWRKMNRARALSFFPPHINRHHRRQIYGNENAELGIDFTG